MTTTFRLAVLALGIAVSAFAADAEVPAELAIYSSQSGSLPPQYAWSTSVTIYLDGQVAVQHCRGYETEGPACTTSNAQTTPEAIASILDAVKASNLTTKAAVENPSPPVGGGSSHAVIFVDGKSITLPPFVIAADADRVAAVLRAIEAAVPASDAHFLTGG